MNQEEIMQSEDFGEELASQIETIKHKVAKRHSLENDLSQTNQEINSLSNNYMRTKLERFAFDLERDKKILALTEQSAADARTVELLHQARENIVSLLHLHEKALDLGFDYEDILLKNIKILDRVTAIGAPFYGDEAEVSFHLTEKDLKKSLKKTNILEVMRVAKRNGWEVKVTDNEVYVHKDGKLVDGKTLKKYFVENNERNEGETCKTTKPIRLTKIQKLKLVKGMAKN